MKCWWCTTILIYDFVLCSFWRQRCQTVRYTDEERHNHL